MISPYYRFCLFLLVISLSVSATVRSQSVAPQVAAQGNTAKPKITYPETQGGLKQLASDILAAQKENKASHAQELLDSLVLPNFREWYSENFSEFAVARSLPGYTATAPTIPAQLAGIFINAYQDGFHTIEAVRYDDESSACSSAPIFSAMTVRRSRVPLYELRFIHGDRFKRIFAFAYVDGTFRFVLIPDFSKPAGQTPDQAKESSSKVARPEERIPAGAAVQAARLVCRVQPYYPEDARQQRISGTVRFHTIIGKDGSVKELEVISGPPMLVVSARWAVSQWRYHPTMLGNEPVEIDTTIDVIYALSN